jgi:hypothetical protein
MVRGISTFFVDYNIYLFPDFWKCKFQQVILGGDSDRIGEPNAIPRRAHGDVVKFFKYLLSPSPTSLFSLKKLSPLITA